MRKELRGQLFWEDQSKFFSAYDYSVWVSVMEKLAAVADRFPYFFPSTSFFFFFSFSSAHHQSGPATEVDETFKYTEISIL